MVDIDPEDPPADTMWERAGERELKIKFLVGYDRLVVTAVLSVGAFALLVGLAAAGPVDVEPLLSGDAVGAAFGSAIIAVITSVTLVLSVSQFVLSGQLAELEELRDRMEAEVEFRHRTEELSAADVAPVQPNRFFRTLLGTVGHHACELDAHARAVDAELEDVLAYTETVLDHAAESRRGLAGAEFGSFDVLLPMLNFNYSWKMHAARAIRSDHGEDLSPEALEALEDLITVLRLVAPAREYFKDHYFRWEVIDTARMTLFSAVPALAVTVYMIFAFDEAAFTGSAAGVPLVYLVVSAAFVLAVLPFTILLSYLLRILTVLKRTLAIGPFVLREVEMDGGRTDQG